MGLIGLGFAGISIKLLVKKDGEFAGTCASSNPLLKDESGTCSVCGARPQDVCLSENPADSPPQS
ncbi:MAG TPA: membrane or secreted protein [Flavobacteriales bacterium]|nr:membrane or secreted protein [Flavobacteriales bacterium]